MTGTIGVGLLFSIIFSDPQSTLNPLPSTQKPATFLAYVPSSTPLPGLPPTWTPTISPTETPALTPFPTDMPVVVEISATPAVDPESVDTSDRQDVSPNPETDMVCMDTECSWPGVVGQHLEVDDYSVNTQSSTPQVPPHAVSASTAPNQADQFLADNQLSDNGISDLFTPEIQYWEEEILDWSQEYELDPNLIATVMQIESCGYLRAKSAAGALGLFQVMPDHFKKKENPYDPNTNAFRGLSWLQRTVKSSDSVSMALAGYNAGIARAKNPDLDWPAETQRYVSWGVEIYRDAQSGYDGSAALQQWLSKGGSSLCNRAAVEQQEQ